jgi:hypothetical protein
MRTLVVAAALALTAHIAAAAPRGAPGVVIASSSDSSPGTLDVRARVQHREIVRRALLDVLHRSGADVRHAGIGVRRLDVAIVAWRVTPSTGQLDVAVELRVVICDETGRMLSILTGRARMSAPDRAPLPALREQVLAEAVRGMTSSLQSQLARAVS